MRQSWGVVLFVICSLTIIGCADSKDEVGGMRAVRQSRKFASDSQDQALGFYSQGSLTNSTVLENSGNGFIKLFPWRMTNWGTNELVDLLRFVAGQFKQLYPVTEPLQFGDLSSQYGGILGHHISHQNGLDADIRYVSKNHHLQDQNYNGFDEEFVLSGKITPNLDLSRNWALLNLFVASEKINRIFVDSAVKGALCRSLKSQQRIEKFRETLKRLRPWPNHQDHFHIRLGCPRSDSKCENQDEVPDETGCP